MPDTRILIVDDSTFDRMVLNKELKRSASEGLALKEANCAQDALEKLDSGEFDAVFVDINMPGENGFFVLRKIRERTVGTWPMVFMLSSSTHPDDINQAYAENATAYLSKPCDLGKMRDLANNCMSLIRGASGQSHAPMLPN